MNPTAAPPLTADDIFTDPLSEPMPAVVEAMRHPDRALRMDLNLADTDLVLAQAFALTHCERHRFDWPANTWRNFDAPAWTMDRDGAPQRSIQRFLMNEAQHRILRPQSAKDMDLATRLAKKLLDGRTVDRIQKLARSQEPMAEDGTRWDADAFLLAVKNGVVDLRTGELRRAVPDDRLTRVCGAAFEESARCDAFLTFLDQVLDGDLELIALVHRFFGYVLTGDTREQVFFVLVGAGSNGKTVLQETIANVLGDYAATVPIATFLTARSQGIPSELADLPGKRLVTSAEPRQAVTLDEGRIKQITGGDEIACRHLYGRWFSFRPAFKLLLSVNHQPRVTDLSHGFWRRVRVVPFRRTFDGSARDNSLPDKLRAESPGILRWLVDGCLEWQRHGLGTAGAVEEAVHGWRSDSDVIREFLESACDLADLDAATSGAEMFRALEAWCERERVEKRDRPSRTVFGTRLKSLLRSKVTNRGIQYLGVKPVVTW